jgi:hypothetical protein
MGEGLGAGELIYAVNPVNLRCVSNRNVIIVSRSTLPSVFHSYPDVQKRYVVLQVDGISYWDIGSFCLF